MRLGVVGINHKLANVKLRELLAQACQNRFRSAACVHPRHSFVLLSTCNRTEIYFSSEELSSTHTYLLDLLRADVNQDFEQKLYTFFGRDCFRHLARVVTGLDSAILGETEIQGQVRTAYEAARDHRKLPEALHFLFQRVLKIGKQVRTEVPLGRGIPTLEHAVLQAGSSFFASPKQARLLFVGASEINLKILAFLKGKGYGRIALCNRTQAKAQSIADQFGIDWIPWAQLVTWPSFDWIVCGTKASQPLILDTHLSLPSKERKLLIDLSVPRNIMPSLGLQPQIHLYNIDQLNMSLLERHRSMSEFAELAERLVEVCSARQIALFHARDVWREAAEKAEKSAHGAA